MRSAHHHSRLARGLAREEGHLRTLTGHESAILLDAATGRVIWRKTGNASSVTFEPPDLREMSGNILTHNHPEGWNYLPGDPRRAGSSFSSDDVAMLVQGQLAEIRAVSPGFIHSLRPPLAGDLSRQGQYFHTHIASRSYAETFEFVEQASEIIGAYNRARINAKADPLTVAEASANHWHQVMEVLVRWWGVHYERKEWLP